MKLTEQTQQQLERFIKKVALKFSHPTDDSVVTDIHLRVSQDTGDLFAFDDNDEEITRCIVDKWIETDDDQFFKNIIPHLQAVLIQLSSTIESMNIMMPFSFVLEDDEGNHIAELYLVDDDIAIIGGDLMQGLSKDLDAFFKTLDIDQSEL